MAYIFIVKKDKLFDREAAALALEQAYSLRLTRLAFVEDERHAGALYQSEIDVLTGQELRKKAAADGFAFDLLVIDHLPSLCEPGVILMDMDMTSVQIEGIDEIARALGVYDKVAALTAQAMHGHLDFASSLKARVSLLKDGEAKVLEHVKSIMRETDGLESLLRTLKAHHWAEGIASGGFVQLISVLEHKYGLDLVRANSLEIQGGRFTGRVEGTIVDAPRKREALFELLKVKGIELRQSIVLGDGANDLPMIKAAGLGIAYHAKPKVKAEAPCCLTYSDLNAVLLLLEAGAKAEI